jgi:hypothetical protein
MATERAGVPSVSLVASTFLPQGKLVAAALGISNPAIVEYPGHPTVDDDSVFEHKLEAMSDRVIEAFATEALAGATTPAPAPTDIIFEGTLDEVQEHFQEKLWTEGLPIVPPTIDRVESFLRFTDRSPDEVIGPLLPENREATVWNVAVNGVMAGCRPEYMPVLVAIVEAIADPEFRIMDGGSTPGWEPLVILNGPIIKQLGFHYGSGNMRVGIQANTSVGRFLRLYMRNVAGLRVTADIGTDKGSIAQTFNVVMAENEDACAELGWEPFSVERGFQPGENVVTVQSVAYLTPPIYTAGSQLRDHADEIVDIFGGSCSHWAHMGLNRFFPLLLVGPNVAEVLAREGWSKDNLRQYLIENSKMPAGKMQEDAYHISVRILDLRERVEQGELPKEFAESADPNRFVPVFLQSDDDHKIGIVVGGDPGRNQSKGYVQNHGQGPPVSKRIELPANWE